MHAPLLDTHPSPTHMAASHIPAAKIDPAAAPLSSSKDAIPEETPLNVRRVIEGSWAREAEDAMRALDEAAEEEVAVGLASQAHSGGEVVVTVAHADGGEAVANADGGGTPVANEALADGGAERDVSAVNACAVSEKAAARAPQRVRSAYVRGWGNGGSERGEFRYPFGIAVHGGEAYVADSYNHRVQVFEAASGRFLRQIGTGVPSAEQGQLHEPVGIAIAAQRGEVLITEFINHRVSVFTAQGTFLRAFGKMGGGSGELKHPKGIAVDPACTEVYVADNRNDRIQVFSIEGAYLRSLGSPGGAPGQFQHPEDVKVSASGSEVYVSDNWNHRIQVLTTEGVFVRALGSGYGTGDGQLWGPSGIALTAHDTVLVCEQGNSRMQELRVDDGAHVCKWGRRGKNKREFGYPWGVAVEGGEVYVCEWANARVQVYV